MKKRTKGRRKDPFIKSDLVITGVLLVPGVHGQTVDVVMMMECGGKWQRVGIVPTRVDLLTFMISGMKNLDEVPTYGVSYNLN